MSPRPVHDRLGDPVVTHGGRCRGGDVPGKTEMRRQRVMLPEGVQVSREVEMGSGVLRDRSVDELRTKSGVSIRSCRIGQLDR